MKINIVSEATYYPAKVRENAHKAAESGGQKSQEAGKTQPFEKILFDKLSSEEATAIQKLFGDFHINDVRRDLDGNNSFAGKLGAIPRGKFVDIKL